MDKPSEPSQDNTEPAGSRKGYGKRPLWQWVALYVVVGIVVYGLIYYFAFYNQKNGSTPYNNTNNSAPSSGLY